ncbi:MAG: helix-turn-helix transcriptional regulator [Treponema sp.]|nr:helix-turn-helix transcriptional regulator [Treponema sp.]
MRNNMSQMALAEKVDISTNFLSDIERCKAWVSPLTLVKIASTLNIEPYQLFKADAFFSIEEKDMLKEYTDENLKAVISLVNKLQR